MKFEIPIAPVTKKNHGQIVMNHGRPVLLPSPQYRQYQKDAAIFVPKDRVDGPVEVSALFFMPTRRRVDLTNLLEGLDDLLVSCGLVEDDNATVIASHDGSRVLYDKERPRTEVSIRQFIS